MCKIHTLYGNLFENLVTCKKLRAKVYAELSKFERQKSFKMLNQDIRQKKIIFESKGRQLFIIAVSILFMLAYYVTKDIADDAYFWVAVFFLGGLSAYLTIRLLNPANDFVAKDSMRGMYLLENEFAIVKEEIGGFLYFEEGFSVEINKETVRINWKEIDTLISYKENRYIVDEICLDIFKKDTKLVALSESVPGWFQFIKRLPPRFHDITPTWYNSMIEDAKKPMVTLLYDRRKRIKQEVLKVCFPDHNYYSMFRDGDGI